MTNEHRHSIGELAKLSGTTVRTIRYYVSEGLLPSPVKKGSYGYYGQSHLNRLKLISMWRDERKTLAEINYFMETMPEEEQKKTLKTIRERNPQIQNLRSSSISNLMVDPVSSVGIPSPGEDEVLDQLAASASSSASEIIGDDHWIRKELVEGVELHYKAGASEGMQIAIDNIVASGRSGLTEQRNREKSPGSKKRSRFFHRKNKQGEK